MKKTYDWDLRLMIEANHNRNRLEIVCSVHTNIHKLKIQIAKRLGLSVLDSHIEIYYRGSLLKATSTLLQNQVQNNAHLTASIARHSLSSQGEENLGEKKGKENVKAKVVTQGLSIVCSCSNSSCINYNQDVEVEYGLGVFPILALTSSTKCEFCPYKSQFLRPNMLCKRVKVSHCFIRLRGSQPDRDGIPVPKDSGFLKVAQQKELVGFLQQRAWHIGAQLTVKHL